MQKRVVISRGDCDVRVAFLEEGKLVEFHIEHLKDRTIVGNIYRGVVQDVIPGLQAAFVEIGEKRNVFLHFMDVRPEALVMLEDDLDAALAEASETQLPGRIDRPGRRPRSDQRGGSAAAPLKKGDTIIVQVIKDEISDKAPRVSTNLALAGRYLVLLPFPGQTGGVSRRVAMGEERMKLKKLLNDLRTDQYSFIVRTAGLGEEEENIRTDVDLLVGQWDALVERFRTMKGPGLVHSDSDIVQRLVRDAFSADIDEVVVDDHDIAEALRLSLSQTLPELADRVMVYDEVEPVFEAYNVEAQMQKALSRKVWLKSGGYLIIEETEALTAIDVNSGRFTGSRDQEKTSFRTNMEACEAIAQQIRLRDIGGIIVVDFIDMLSRENQNTVGDEFRHQMRHDRAKYTIGRIGDFGLMTITRKRKHMSLQKQIFDECPYCHGEGLVLSGEEVWRRMRHDLEELAVDRARYSGVVVCSDPFIANKLRTEFAEYLSEFTKDSGLEVILRADPSVHREDYTLTAVEKPTRQSAQLPAKRVDVDDIFVAPIAWEMRPETNVPPAVAGAPVETEKPLERRHAPPPPRQQSQRDGRPQHGRPPQQQPPAAKTITPVSKPAGPLAGAPPADAADAAAGDAAGRKRKRRGRRGGRGRRKGQQLDANGQPIAASPDQTPLEGDVLDNAAALEGEMPNPDQPLFELGDEAEDVEELLDGEESDEVEVSEAAPFELEEDEKAAEEVADFAPAVIEHRTPPPREERPARPEREERGGRDRGREDRGGRFGDRGRDRDRGPRGERPVPATPDPANKKSKMQVVARFGGVGEGTAKLPVKAGRPTPDVKALKPIENVTLSSGHRTRAVKILGMWGPQSAGSAPAAKPAPTPAPAPAAAAQPPVRREDRRPPRPERPGRDQVTPPAAPTLHVSPKEALAATDAVVKAEAADPKPTPAPRPQGGGRPRKSAKKAAKAAVAPPPAKKAAAKPAPKAPPKPVAASPAKKAAAKKGASKPAAKAAPKPAAKPAAKSAAKPAAKKAAKKAAKAKS